MFYFQFDDLSYPPKSFPAGKKSGTVTITKTIPTKPTKSGENDTIIYTFRLIDYKNLT